MTQASHIAGIIPVANLNHDFDGPISPLLMPVARGYTAIQKSVFECAIAGCRTIWIVCNNDVAPLIRHVIGDWIYDPVYLSRPHVQFPSEHQREIPIYYVSLHPKDMKRRDSYGWSVLYGINSAWRVANIISQWLIPEKYFISFPLALYNIYSLRGSRRKIASIESNYFLSYKGKTVKDNCPLVFTMRGEDFIECRRHVNKLTTREYRNPDPSQKFPQEKLPLLERWSARHFDFETVFAKVEEAGATHDALEWFYDMSYWEEYCAFLGSDNFIKKPANSLTRAHKHATIPYRVEEGNENT